MLFKINMGKILAIKGHPTRGREVIELLEMLGGINESNHKGKGENSIYYLRYYVDNVMADILYQTYPNTNDDDFKIFTLEEFLEKYPYKVGDEFCNPYDKITEMFWDEEDEIVYYKTEYSRDYVTATDIMLDSYARIK
jgi:hypothetical protein